LAIVKVRRRSRHKSDLLSIGARGLSPAHHGIEGDGLMAGRRTFFSFHYQRDIWRATNVRNSGAIETKLQAGWVDASLWEATKRKGSAAIRQLIEQGLKGTSVTVVLIGAQTAERPWVRYEITRSLERGNGVIGVRIHQIKDQDGRKDHAGPVPQLLVDNKCKVYDWNRQALAGQVERAAIRAGKPCLAHDKKDCFICQYIKPLW
jgi:MTH538 TIR-like domain (DUF1863)